jgi:hypothetical protein
MFVLPHEPNRCYWLDGDAPNNNDKLESIWFDNHGAWNQSNASLYAVNASSPDPVLYRSVSAPNVGQLQPNQTSAGAPSTHPQLPPFPNAIELWQAGQVNRSFDYRSVRMVPMDKEVAAVPDQLPLLTSFVLMYRTHCERVLDSLLRCNLPEFHGYLAYFWQSLPQHLQPLLSQPSLHALLGLCDCLFYKSVVRFLAAPIHQSTNSTRYVTSLQSPFPKQSITLFLLSIDRIKSAWKMLDRFSDHLEVSTRMAVRQQPEPLILLKCSLAQNCSTILRHLSRVGRLIGCLKLHCHSNKPLIHIFLKYPFESLMFEPDPIDLSFQFDAIEIECAQTGRDCQSPS